MELQMWKEILTPYDLAVEELKVKFNHIVKVAIKYFIYSGKRIFPAKSVQNR